MAEMRGKWIHIEKQPQNPKKVTNDYKVKTNDYEGGFDLGDIKWYSAWRGYAFFPNPNCVFEATCLGTICDWLRLLNREYRNLKKNDKTYDDDH